MPNPYCDTIQRFSGLHAVVIGEAMLDRYSTGHSKRLSVEAPVPIIDNCSTLNFAGAAANAAINLRTLGSRVSLVSAIGNDADATALHDILLQRDVNVEHMSRAATRQTLSKHRVLAGTHMIARFDHGTISALSVNDERALLGALDACIPQADLVVVSDYNYGILTSRIIEHLATLLHNKSLCVAADSRRLDQLGALRPTVVKPNFREAMQLFGMIENASDRVTQVLELGAGVLDRTQARIAAVTLDEDGAIVFERGRRPIRTSADPRPHSQAAGAGDTYLAAFSLALAAGAATESAAEVAAAAAAVVVDKSHTSTCAAQELLMAMDAHNATNDLAGLTFQMERHRQAGRRIVLTNGCFDILHRGHVAYLERAKSLGDVLVVGVNSDESIRQLKGSDRPINCLEDRLGVLAALSCVDHLASFDELMPNRLIEAVRPDIFVKGGDYTRDTLPEASLVEALGGRVVILPYLRNHSTTGIVERIRHGELTSSLERNGKHPHAPIALGMRSKRPLR